MIVIRYCPKFCVCVCDKNKNKSNMPPSHAHIFFFSPSWIFLLTIANDFHQLFTWKYAFPYVTVKLFKLCFTSKVPVLVSKSSFPPCLEFLMNTYLLGHHWVDDRLPEWAFQMLDKLEIYKPKVRGELKLCVNMNRVHRGKMLFTAGSSRIGGFIFYLVA